jgi:hypothetical protein
MTISLFLQAFLDYLMFLKRLAAEADSKAQQDKQSILQIDHIRAVQKVGPHIDSIPVFSTAFEWIYLFLNKKFLETHLDYNHPYIHDIIVLICHSFHFRMS